MVAYIITCKTGFYISYFTLMLIWVFSSTVDPECIPCKSTDQVLNEDGEFLKCDEQSNSNSSLSSSPPDRPRPNRPRPSRPVIGRIRTCPKGQMCSDERGGSIGGSGFRVCGKGQVTDTRGVCKTTISSKTAYLRRYLSSSRPKKEKDVEPREITSPKPKINLREYLQRLHSF